MLRGFFLTRAAPIMCTTVSFLCCYNYNYSINTKYAGITVTAEFVDGAEKHKNQSQVYYK